MPNLPGKVWATLADGTPLVTAKRAGQGPDRALPRDRQCRLVEPAAVRPLRRNAAPRARSCTRRRRRRRTGASAQADAQAFAPWRALDGFGELTDPSPDIQPIPAAAIDKAQRHRRNARRPLSPRRAGARHSTSRAAATRLKPIAGLPAAVTLRSLHAAPRTAAGALCLRARHAAVPADCLAALFLGGGMNACAQRRAAAAARWCLPCCCAAMHGPRTCSVYG